MTISFETCRPILLGLRGFTLEADEKAWLEKIRPMGVLLFGRNISTKEQVQKLCQDVAPFLPKIFDNDGVALPLIAVDQEGGRVQRLLFNGRRPSAQELGNLALQSQAGAEEAAELHGFLLANDLREVGATWVMGPCIDLAYPETHAIIGNRAFSANPHIVTALAKATLTGIEKAGAIGCLKHAPGHGQAKTDSHIELPTIYAELEGLQNDWLPYKTLCSGLTKSPFLMTAHISYPLVQRVANVPATFDKEFLERLSADWSFQGIWMADDLGMQALSGTYLQRATRALDAGCELLICSFSKLQHGMAGTVFDEANFNEFYDAIELIPAMSQRVASILSHLNLEKQASLEKVQEVETRFNALCRGNQPDVA